MGSRLKGKRVKKSQQRERRALVKVLIYGLLGLGVIALLWALWLSNRGMKVAEEMKHKPTPGQTTGGP